MARHSAGAPGGVHSDNVRAPKSDNDTFTHADPIRHAYLENANAGNHRTLRARDRADGRADCDIQPDAVR